MRFEHANMLWLLLVIPPALAAFFWWSERVKRGLLAQFVEPRLLPQLTSGLSPQRRQWKYALLILATVGVIVAIARPQYGFDLEEVRQSGLDIIVAVDTSKSMLAADVAPNRLARAKLAALELAQTARADRLGLVAFAGNAFLSCPLTIDDTAFQQSVQALDVNSIPQGGTALAAAIDTALDAFKDKGNHRALVIFTDGEDHDEGAQAAAERAMKDGMRIFTIGIGSAEGTLITIPDGSGNSDYVRDEHGNVVKSRLNEPLLEQITAATGGFNLPLRGADTITTLYERGLAPMPKSEGREKLVRRYHEQFHIPLAVAMLLLAAEFLMPERRRRKKASGDVSPRPGSPGKGGGGRLRSPGMVSLLIGAASIFSAGPSQASPSSALQDYRSGNYTNALGEYTRLAAERTNDLRLVFNAGAAAYRGTNYDLARGLFERASLSPDLELQQKAFYNLGNVQFQKAKEAKDLDSLEQGFDAAAKIFERALMLNTNDADASFNLGVSRNAAEQVRAIKAALQAAKTSADQAVQRAEFRRALDIMESLTQKYRIAGKQFEEFTKKLKEIDEIANPSTPVAPAQAP